MCLHLVVMDRAGQPKSVALGCTIINWLAATISVCVAYVEGFSMGWSQCSTLCLVLCLRRSERLMYSSFISVERRARSTVFPSEPATT